VVLLLSKARAISNQLVHMNRIAPSIINHHLIINQQSRLRIVRKLSTNLPNPLQAMSNEFRDKRYRIFGPTTVTDVSGVEVPNKLYNFCKRAFPHLSKRALLKCFKFGSILVNGQGIRCGHDDEPKRLVLGDVIEIRIDLDAADSLG
jgi:hypothetical protein